MLFVLNYFFCPLRGRGWGEPRVFQLSFFSGEKKESFGKERKA